MYVEGGRLLFEYGLLTPYGDIKFGQPCSGNAIKRIQS